MFTKKFEDNDVTIKVDEENKVSTYSLTDDTVEAIKKVMFAVEKIRNVGDFEICEEEYSMNKIIIGLGQILKNENVLITKDGTVYYI